MASDELETLWSPLLRVCYDDAMIELASRRDAACYGMTAAVPTSVSTERALRLHSGPALAPLRHRRNKNTIARLKSDHLRESVSETIAISSAQDRMQTAVGNVQ
jgi:hypothetical protein